jgi:hypothetical protein
MYSSVSQLNAGCLITNAYGYYASSMSAATNEYAFYGNTTAGATRWNLYMAGAGKNYLAGSLGIGTTVPASLLDISSATGGIMTLSRNDTTATAADVIGTLQWWNNDTQLTTQNIYANIVVTATSTVTTDAAAGTMKFNVTGSTAGGSPIEHMQFAPTTVAKIGFFGAAAVVQPTAYTQTYSTAAKTVPNATQASVTDTNGLAGFLAAADRTALVTAVNAAGADILALKKVVNALIDDLQSLGLAQ